MQEKINYTLAENEVLPKKLTPFFGILLKNNPLRSLSFFSSLIVSFRNQYYPLFFKDDY